MTEVMRKGMTVRDFMQEAVRCNVPGLPFVDEKDRIIGRISVHDVFRRIAVPNSYLRIVDAIGDETNRLDMSEKRILNSVAQPIERYLLETIPSVSPASSVVKALVIMEAYDTHYICLIEDGKYRGIVTRMVLAKRLLDWLDEVDRGESLPSG
jgi:CBS domain-containing protein